MMVSIQIGFYVHGKVLKLRNENGKTKVTRNVGRIKFTEKERKKLQIKHIQLSTHIFVYTRVALIDFCSNPPRWLHESMNKPVLSIYIALIAF